MYLFELSLLVIGIGAAVFAIRSWRILGSPDSGHDKKQPRQEASAQSATENVGRSEMTKREEEIAALMLEADDFIRHSVLSTNGTDLANRLQMAAMDLGYNKATEFSPDIKALELRSAKVALLTFGRHSDAIKPFENCINYYNSFPYATIGEEYDAFKASLYRARDSA